MDDVAFNSNITELLIDWSNGNRTALETLLPLVQRELHRLAHRYMDKERAGHTLQTTALVNEAFLRLIDQKRVRWQNRAHFFAIASQIMRRFLINYARDRQRFKRGGKAIHLSLSEACLISVEKSEELLALEEALVRLDALHHRKSLVVELRYYGGLTVKEIAEVLNVSKGTVMRDWTFAQAWLKREIANDE